MSLLLGGVPGAQRGGVGFNRCRDVPTHPDLRCAPATLVLVRVPSAAKRRGVAPLQKEFTYGLFNESADIARLCKFSLFRTRVR